MPSFSARIDLSVPPTSPMHVISLEVTEKPMKRLFLVITALVSSVAACQQIPSSSTAAQSGASGSSVSDPQAGQVAPDVAEFDKQMAQAQQNMRKMDEQMARIHQTQDPKERQLLLQEHWQTMQDNMRLMHSMGGPGMMGCCGAGPMRGMASGGASSSGSSGGPMMGQGPMMGHGPMGWQGMGGYYSQMSPEQLRQRQYMSDQYLSMQQMMMNQMMQHQGWINQPPTQK